jgi:hypothetical protein
VCNLQNGIRGNLRICSSPARFYCPSPRPSPYSSPKIYPKFCSNLWKIKKIIALLGPLLKQVNPQPAYKPLIPLVLHIVFAVCPKLAFGAPGFNSPQVCMDDFTLSAGNRMTLYDTPARAPDAINSIVDKSLFVALG